MGEEPNHTTEILVPLEIIQYSLGQTCRKLFLSICIQNLHSELKIVGYMLIQIRTWEGMEKTLLKTLYCRQILVEFESFRFFAPV